MAHARRDWLEATHDPAARLRRDQSDFLLETNDDGERLDFHSLRHTCGAWLAITGAHPNIVQTVMRHNKITLTMDTYGHLFPGQEAEAVGRINRFCGGSAKAEARQNQATGTDVPNDSRRKGEAGGANLFQKSPLTQIDTRG